MVLEQSESNSTPHAEPTASAPASSARSGVSQDLAAGLFLIALAAIAGWQGSHLTVGSLRQIGPGLLPLALAALTGLSGLGLVLRSLKQKGGGARLGRWGVRGPVFVLGGAVFFGLTIRSIGLVVAGPGVVLIAVLASKERRWREAIVFALSMTLFCVVLFKLILQLPIPLFPILIGF
jgi:putative tricarboxylic transport membrane protein